MYKDGQDRALPSGAHNVGWEPGCWNLGTWQAPTNHRLSTKGPQKRPSTSEPGVFGGRTELEVHTVRAYSCRHLEDNVWREVLHRDGWGGGRYQISSTYKAQLSNLRGRENHARVVKQGRDTHMCTFLGFWFCFLFVFFFFFLCDRVSSF